MHVANDVYFVLF